LEASYAPPTSGATKTTFDADRRPLVTTRPDGSTWTRTYDTAGRPASFGYAGGLTIATSYDDKGRVSALAGPGAESVAVSYDGPLVTSLAFTGAATGTLGWTYDPRFRVSREEINGSFGVDVAYDHDGLVTSVGDLTLDRETTTGRILSLAVGSVKTTATYSPYGEVATLGSSDGVSTMLDLAFTYDVLGRITTKTDTEVVWAYAYDLAGRLANVKKDGVAVASYTYDANGNRLNDGATYDEEDRQLTGNGATFTYPPNGERQTRIEASATTTYHLPVGRPSPGTAGPPTDDLRRRRLPPAYDVRGLFRPSTGRPSCEGGARSESDDLGLDVGRHVALGPWRALAARVVNRGSAHVVLGSRGDLRRRAPLRALVAVDGPQLRSGDHVARRANHGARLSSKNGHLPRFRASGHSSSTAELHLRADTRRSNEARDVPLPTKRGRAHPPRHLALSERGGCQHGRARARGGCAAHRGRTSRREPGKVGRCAVASSHSGNSLRSKPSLPLRCAALFGARALPPPSPRG
jgi:YD repeat-containing protein